jgi:hypothetical protein
MPQVGYIKASMGWAYMYVKCLCPLLNCVTTVFLNITKKLQQHGYLP